MLKRLTGWRAGATEQADTEAVVRDAAGLSRYAAARAGTLPDREALLQLRPALRRSLSKQFGVETLAARLCPVELEDGSAAIFALADHVGSDQADELARRLEQAGYQLTEPARYVLHASL